MDFYISLIFGEIGQLTGEDPRQIQIIALIIEGCATVLFDLDRCEQLTKKTRELTSALSCALERKDEAGEKQAQAANVAYIQQFILNLEYTLTGKELAAFTVGRLLGTWDTLETKDDTLNTELKKRILASISALMTDDRVPEEILQRIEDYHQRPRSISSIYVPGIIHKMIKDIVLYREMGLERT